MTFFKTGKLFEVLPAVLPVVAGLIGLVSLAFASAPTIWRLAGHDPSPRPIRVEQPAQVSSIAQPVSLTSIDSWSPFGLFVSEKTSQPLRETSLGLILRGVLVSSNPSQSSATIEAAKETGLYLVGDTIAGRAIVLKVFPNQVLLNVDGTREMLSFQIEETKQPAARQDGLSRLKAAVNTGQAGTAKNPSKLKTTDDYISYWRGRIAKNPATVLDEVGLIATDKGYRIAKKHDVGVRKAGLKAGDLITTVNGKQVGNVEKDRKLYDQIDAAGQARIEVLRNGKKIILTFPLR